MRITTRWVHGNRRGVRLPGERPEPAHPMHALLSAGAGHLSNLTLFLREGGLIQQNPTHAWQCVGRDARTPRRTNGRVGRDA